MLATILTALVALIHAYIVVLEMVLWDTPRGRAAFGMSAEQAASTKVLALNQGLYNGFLVAGLLWALIDGVHGAGFAPALFFLACVAVAGVVGALTVSRRILLIQTAPAALGLIALLLGW